MSNLTPSILKFESPRLAEIKQHLRLDLECAADWRERKALQHPDDERNLEAAAILDRLIQTIDDINPVVRNSYGKLFRSSDAGLVEANIEAHNVMLRQVGFRSRPETAEEVCCEFIQTAGAAPQPQTAQSFANGFPTQPCKPRDEGLDW
jgi:hypothetical protein